MNLTDVRTNIWQLSAAQQGQVEDGADSIAQSMLLLLATVPGTDPFRPTFGSALWELVDRPVTAAPQAAASIRRSLNTWMPEITVVDVAYQYVTSTGALAGESTGNVPEGARFDIVWRPSSVYGSASEISLYFGSPGGSDAAATVLTVLAAPGGGALLDSNNLYIVMA